MSENKNLTQPLIFKEDKKPLENALIFDVPDRGYEDKAYLILNVFDNDGFDGTFKICYGRTQTYRFIERMCQEFGTDWDPYESRVITETKQTETDSGNRKYYLLDFEDSMSVYAFCKSLENYYEGTNVDFKIGDYFPDPPDGEAMIVVNQRRLIKDKEIARVSNIKDPELAKFMMDTIKERQNSQPLDKSTTPIWEEKDKNPRDEFPDLFEDESGNNV